LKANGNVLVAAFKQRKPNPINGFGSFHQPPMMPARLASGGSFCLIHLSPLKIPSGDPLDDAGKLTGTFVGHLLSALTNAMRR
jgi:hypothetical protein